MRISACLTLHFSSNSIGSSEAEDCDLVAWKIAIAVCRTTKHSKGIGVELGESIHDKILPAIISLKAEMELMRLHST